MNLQQHFEYSSLCLWPRFAYTVELTVIVANIIYIALGMLSVNYYGLHYFNDSFQCTILY